VDDRHPTADRRGEITKPRPWVVISARKRLHQNRFNSIIGVPLSKKVAKLQSGPYRDARIQVPAELITSTDARFEKVLCMAMPEHVRALDLDRCDAIVGSVDLSVANSIRGAVGYMIGLG